MSTETFKDNFWGVGGFDQLEKRINQGTESTKLFLYFMKERASIEESYAKSLTSLLKKTANLTEFGTLRDAWLAVRGQVESTVGIHTEFSRQLSMDIVSSFDRFKSDQKKTKKTFLHDAWKLSKERKDQESSIAKYRTKYEDYSKQSEQFNSQLEQAKSRGGNVNDLGKLDQKISSKAQKANKERQMFENDYRDAVNKLQTNAPAWVEKTCSIYQTLQGCEEERIDCIKIQLDKYSQAITSLENSSSNVNLSSIISKVDKYEDIDCFIRENKTGSDPPPIPSFVQFGARDYGDTPSMSSSVSSSSLSASYSNTNASSSAPLNSSSRASSTSSSSSSSILSKPVSKAPPPAVMSRKPPAKKMKALYDYVGSDATELDFFTGDTITVLGEDESGWWKGSLDGREGLFPSNYCELV
ncbi:hypothetical protein SAMD00019534_116620 [Acytostelium subglobosum LB1]|uniref:hypothetical protein n=1 Tax=Acytostelium subglobosum LB1 TaxID=1410327 RepID=UPI000644E770|nr:hypothetical protein SAMD00019534_116620 [Acytostelium subglobosum LB1]GAM28486.1 hypothetical protein SAMD00019534_116620 [Acytostelium subglobosum LB1]|eukprot:XP_012748525.1 hypothetical protein SAMD00019534_116620 [Acytostelium subglobosum LB1]